MKDPKCEDADPALYLTPSEHDILLGTLKKVEAKNASLFGAWVFLAAANTALLTTETFSEHLCYAISFLLLLLPFIFASLCGMRQIDVHDMLKYDATVLDDEKKLAKKMQCALLQDLIRKERLFQFSYIGAFVMVFFGVCGLVYLGAGK